MGFSTSGAVAVLLIAALISAGVIVPAVQSSADEVERAFNDRTNHAVAIENTDVELRNATYDAEADTFTLTAENVGTTTLTVADVDLLLDGDYVSERRTAVESRSSRTAWAPGETLTVTVERSAQPTRALVATKGGISRATGNVTVVS
ncbi:flagellar protein FlaF [Halarchaeum rubridurum]|uniref:Flagellar protein FlaF n=1 Tax=Halarchaeum rubridurum TaxID=489911 RepID=A0A830G177_9EURY|nr:hypothetical protein [Halarchaeum rubridurum]MBP1954917.1 flagellar protein FlaF [Halarchaeum rubridurum]GGM70378.1 hypothetical protein GCM10009017_20740 [Halarchaeum rubridurum]